MVKRKNRIRRREPEELRTVIEDVAFMGEGLAHENGQAVFIPHTIPGEEVLAEVNRQGPRHLEADLKQVLSPSPHRVDPPCPYYGECTGCQWQHMDYGYQLSLKRKLVEDQLRRVGGFDQAPIAPVLGCDDPWSYRNHARFTVGRNGTLGFVNRTSRKFVQVDRCIIMDEGVNGLLASLQGKCGETTQLSVRYGTGTGDWLIQPTMQSLDIEVDTGQPRYWEELAGRRFRISSPSFFQVNTRQAATLFDVVWGRLNLSGRETVVDAYAGVGTFAVLLAPYAKRVLAIEESAAAMKDAEANTEGLENVELVLGRTEEVLAGLPKAPDAVVLDPPRSGCLAGTLEALAERPPARVVYVSCEPATLARDLRFLCDAAYELLEVQPIDMFPHTYHVEAVATLQRRIGPAPLSHQPS